MTVDRRAGVARSILAAGLGTVALLCLAGFAAADSPAPSASGAPAASGGPAISIVQKTFQPADLTIQAGQTVTWTVTDAISDSHSVTSGTVTDAHPGSVFDSGITLHNNGDSFSFTFATPGTYPYFCAVHPATMHGTITVVAAAGGGPPARTDTSSKLITAVILAVAILLLLGWARLYRRMNPG
jgi:plastocyanin